MTDKERSKKVLSIIKKRNLLNQASWIAQREFENVQSIILYPTKSIFSQEIEDTFEDGWGWIRSLNIEYKEAIIRTSRGYLSDITFYSVDDLIKFIKEMNLDVDFLAYLHDTEVTLDCYKNCVKTLDKFVKEIKKYEKGKQK